MSDAKAKYRRKLEERAKRLGISFSHVTTNSELLALVEKKEKPPTAPAVIEGKAVEVKSEIIKPSPTPPAAPAHIHAGQPVQLAINVPIPAINYGSHPAPAWWEVVCRVKDAVLYMVAGAALYAVAMSRLF